MRVTLIYPLLSNKRSRVDENKQYWPPLGLAYIAGVLVQNGHSVQIIDRDLIFRKEKLNFEKTNQVTLEKMSSFESDAVGFSATTPNISDVKIFSSIVKKHNPEILTILGGPHITGETEFTLELCSDIDIGVRGEGEETMLEIANTVSLERIAGISYRKNSRLFSNKDRQLIAEIDKIPPPARLLLDMEFYTRPSRFTSRNLSLRTTHIFTARGCPYSCHYCAGPLMGRHKVRFHSPERVLKEVNELITRYKVEAVYFAEDMFLSNEQRANQILELFIKHEINKKIVWMAQLSTNNINSKLLNLMKRAGCVHVEYGFESGSQKVLDLMNKRSTVEQNIRAALLTKKTGLRFQGNFIVGYPGETESDFKQTMQFIKKIKPNQVSVNMFMPLPGTFIYNKLHNEKKLLPGWDDIGNQDTPHLNYADMPAQKFETLYLKFRLTVVIPMNLKNFIIGNLSHPLRFGYIIFTQSLGLLVKLFIILKKLFKLTFLRKFYLINF